MARSLTHNRELVDRTERALDAGALAPADLRRLLGRADRQRAIDPGGLFRALGVLTAIAGAAFLYIIDYGDLSRDAQKLTPFVFPAVLLLGAVALDRIRRPAWEVELCATVGDIVLGLTFVGASSAWGQSRGYGLWAALISLAVSAGMYPALRLVRLTTWAAAASIVALAAFLAADAGPWSIARTFLVQAIIAAAVGAALLGWTRPVATQALYLAALLAELAGTVGVIADAVRSGNSGVSSWAVVLFATALASLALAAVAEIGGLLWLGALGALLTLAAVVEPARSDRQWAYLMVAIGVTLAISGAAVHRARRQVPGLGEPG